MAEKSEVVKDEIWILTEHLSWTEEQARAWMEKPNLSLGGITPRAYLEKWGEPTFDHWVREQKERIKSQA